MNAINLNENIKAFENKLTTYIDVYNITYTNNTNTNTDDKNIMINFIYMMKLTKLMTILSYITLL